MVGAMRIVIAGGHGQIALRLEQLVAARGDEVAGIIRTPKTSGGSPRRGRRAYRRRSGVGIRHGLAQHLEAADAAVFVAGAGPGSGIDRQDSVDRAAAALFADAAEQAGVRRFLIVSAMGADR
jgi:nucleoside-diphosphate-sugar epimerase